VANHTFGLSFLSSNEVSDVISSISNDIRFKKYTDYLIDTYISEEAKFRYNHLGYKYHVTSSHYTIRYLIIILITIQS